MILIIDRRRDDARVIATMFYYMGVLSSAVTPAEAIHKISNRYKAILITTPEKTEISDEFFKTLRAYSLGTPIFALCDSIEDFASRYPARAELYDGLLSARGVSSTLLSRLNERLSEMGKTTLGEYRLAGINADIESGSVTFFDKPIALTKTEQMMLRYLITMYPVQVSAKEMILYSVKPGRCPEPSNVRTHISNLNKKFRELTGRAWIYSDPGIGYRLLTPELATVIEET